MGLSSRKLGSGLATTTLVLCLAALAAAPSASARLAESLAGGKTTFVLDKRLFTALEAAGVGIEPLGQATLDGRRIEMPLASGFLEYGRGTGYAFERGGLRFRGPGGAATVRKLVLNTAKGKLTGRVNGHAVALAWTRGVDGTPTRYGLEVAVNRLVLSGAGARDLGRALGRRNLFAPGATFARARVSGETYVVPLEPAEIAFSFDEAFRAKLAALGIAVSASGAATETATAPLSFAFPDATGQGNRGVTQGVVGSRSFLHLTRGSFPDAQEATVAVSASLEALYAGTVSKGGSAFSGAPLGEGDLAAATVFDPAPGTLSAPPTPVSLAPYGAQVLNEAFAPGMPAQFSAGEALGLLSFSGRLGR